MTGPEDQAADRHRAGHADREQAIRALKDAFVQDRLTRDELDERAGRALAARTHAELAALTADIPGDLAAVPVLRLAAARVSGVARPSLMQRRPLVCAAAGAGGGLAIAFGLILFAANVLDPNGLGNPYHPWSSLCALVALVTVFVGGCISVHGLGTAAEQRRARGQLPPGSQGEAGPGSLESR